MKVWSLVAALSVMSLMGCTVREAPPPSAPDANHHHVEAKARRPGASAVRRQPPAEMIPKEARRYRRYRSRLAHR